MVEISFQHFIIIDAPKVIKMNFEHFAKVDHKGRRRRKTEREKIRW